MSSKQNLVFIMPDQLRADFLSCYGAEFIATPNMDRLAERGVRYENGYSSSPICVPARASLLTGQNAIKNGVLANSHFLRPDLTECGIQTWPEYLNQAGYTTAAIGKMHFYPWDASMGFQHRVIAEDKRYPLIQDDYANYLAQNGYRKTHGSEHAGYYEHKGAIINDIPWEHSIDHFVGQETCKFIREHKDDQPFALMVGFPGPHCPYDPNPEYLDQFDPADMPEPIPDNGLTPKLRDKCVTQNRSPWNGVDYTEFTVGEKKKIRAHYAALVKQVDFEVGQILATLEESGQLENTIIIFSSDHGDHLGDHNLIGKGNFYQSSIHVPLIVYLPWATEGKSCSDIVALEDVTASLLHFAGCEIPKHFDAIPLPRLDIPVSAPRKYIFGFLLDSWMIFDGQWKLIKSSLDGSLLFNLETDPHEQRNVIAEPEFQQIVNRLDQALGTEIQRSICAANQDRRVAHRPLTDDDDFGKPGWSRSYPMKERQ